MDSVVRAFREVADSEKARSSINDEDTLPDRLAAFLARGRAAHPDLALAPALFARHLARASGDAPNGALEHLAIEDLYLAAACAEKVAGAAALFEKRYGRVIQKAVARVIGKGLDQDEAVQLARRALLMGGEDGSPKLAQYRGQGPLESWVSVTAIRVAVSLGRAEGSARRLRERAAGELASAVDPELLYIKGEVQREVEAAFEHALRQLEHRERLVLRFYLVSGMTLENIGQTFGVAHQTVSRWLAKARKAVLRDVRRQLGDRLRVSGPDLASLTALVASRIDLSLSRLLGTG